MFQYRIIWGITIEVYECGIDCKKLKEQWVTIPAIVSTPSNIIRLIRIGSRNLLVDIPINYYRQFLDALYNLSYVYNNKLEKALREKEISRAITILKEYETHLKKLINGYNIALDQRNLGWFKLYYRRNRYRPPIVVGEIPIFDKNNYIITYRISWSKFCNFIKEYIIGDKYDLPRKYEYIYSIKYYLINEVMRQGTTIFDKLRINVREVVAPYNAGSEVNLLKISEKIDDYLEYIRYQKIRLYKNSIKTRNHCLYITYKLMSVMEPTFLSLKESTLSLANYLSNPPLIYRELRNIIEVLAEILLILDIYRSTLETLYQYITVTADYSDNMENNLTLLLANMLNYVYLIFSSKEYYENISKKSLLVRNIGEIKKLITDEIIVPALKSNNIALSKSKIIDNIKTYHLISLPIVLVYGGLKVYKNKINVKDLDQYVQYIIEKHLDLVEDVTKLAAFDIIRILANQLNKKGLDEETKESMYASIVDIIKDKINNYYPPIFSSTAMLQYVSSITDKILENKYNDYSFFVHGYLTSHSVLAYTSILEYMILCSELSKIAKYMNKYYTKIMDITNEIISLCSNMDTIFYK